jgi:DNA-binding CsgD family transcriptional regulator
MGALDARPWYAGWNSYPDNGRAGNRPRWLVESRLVPLFFCSRIASGFLVFWAFSMSNPPYILSNWVRDEHFYGREQLCRTLAETPERCVFLVGTRRIGKTSLLMRLAAQLRPVSVYCDLMRAVGADQLDEARMIALMRRQIAANAAQSEPLRDSRAAWDRDGESLCAWLEELSWRWEELGLMVTLLWDEAELLRRLPNSTLMPLRSILQHSNSLRIVLCASKGLADLNDRWRDEYVSPFLFGFRTEYIAGLDDEAANALVRQRGRVQVADDVAETIRAWTGNHPFLIQSLCSRLYQGGTLRAPRSGDLIVDTMLADLFRIDISALSPGEQQILMALAQHGPLRRTELHEQTALLDESLGGFLDGLSRLGLLREEHERWQIGNAFLATWLRSQPPQAGSHVTDRASLEVVDPQRARQMQERGTVLLSERERSVLRLVSAGHSNPEIARELVISLETVKAHLKNIAAKLGSGNRAQAVARAKELGLI